MRKQSFVKLAKVLLLECSFCVLNSIVSAQTNYAGTFNGSTSVSIPHNNNQLGTAMTFEAWINPANNAAGGANILMKGNYGYGIHLGADGCSSGANIGYWVDGACYNVINTSGAGGAVPYNTWSHIAVVVTTSPTKSLSFYINGNLVETSTSSGITINDGWFDALILGMQGTGCSCNYYYGQMDELRIWNVARTQAEIQNNMNTSISPATAGLSAYYQFNEGSGNTLVDATSNAVNGTWSSSNNYTTSGVTINNPCTPTTSDTTQTACDSIMWNGITYTASGTYTWHGINAGGCDSTATLNLTINQSSSSTDTQAACDSLVWNGVTYTASGTYTWTGTNAAGCDSTATLNLTVNHSSTSTTATTACDSLIWNGVTYTASGTYTWIGTNAAGCDSTATLDVIVNHSSTSSTTTTACDSLIWNGVTYTASGTYTWIGTNAAGCDSTATLNLSVNYSSTSSTTVTVCDSLVWNGTTYTSSGIYTWHGTNAAGCDSTATLDVTVNHSTTSSTSVTVCDSLIWNGTIYKVAGNYSVHFTNAVGCDSTATLHLTVNNTPTVDSIVGLTNIEILAIGGGGGAGGPDGPVGAGGGAGGAVYGKYTLPANGNSFYTVGVGGGGGYGQGCAGNAPGGTAGANGGGIGGNAGPGGCSGGGGGGGGWSGFFQGSTYYVVAGGGAGGGGSNEGTANDITTPGGGNQSIANGTSMTGQNGTAYSGDGGGGGAGGGGFYGGAGQSGLNQTNLTTSQAWGGANYTNPTNRNAFANYTGNSGALSGGGGTGGQGTTTTITNSSNFNYINTYGKGGNAQGNGGVSTTANGNNGVVIIRYQGSPVATGGTVTQSGGYTLHTFTTTGSNTFRANSASAVCVGSTTFLSCATPNGVWSSSDTTIATINPSTGMVTGIVPGVVTISYSVTSAQGCVGKSTKQFTVNPLPVVPAITGNTTICDNTTTLLGNTLTGGIWSSSNIAKATVNSSTGLVSGVAAGTSTITYLYTDNNGCSNTNSTVVTINASPTVAAISGNAGVCIGSTTTYTDATLNGTWSSGNANIATINSGGLISTVATGSSVISYTVINANACTTVVTKTIAVNALPNVTANATATTVCYGTQTTLTGGGASSYTWNNGVTNGVAFAPTATNTYQVTGTDGNGCVKTANITINVNPLPIVSISPSVTTVCNGYPATLTASGASTYGWTIVGSAPYLDQVSSTSTLKLAAGLHKLKSSYSGSAIRIRRSSDNTEQNFGFNGNDLDVAAISTFVGAGTAYVTTIYDQSGNGNHLTQTSTGNQPTLTLSGLNGKPVIHTNTSQNIYVNVNFPPPFTVVYAARQTGGSRGRLLAGVNNNWLLGWWGGSKGQAHFDGWITNAGGNASDNNVYVYSGTGTGSSSSFAYQNKVSITTNPAGGNTGPNGISYNRSESSDADFTDVVEFNSVLSTSDRNIVENGIGAYYGLSGFYNTTGAVTTVYPGTTTNYTVYGTDGNGCIGTASQVVNVNPKPNAGTDVNYLCGGATQVLNGTTTNGTWTAMGTNPTGANLSSTTSGSASVIFDNLASGTYNFIYTLPTNCSDTMSIIVRPKPNAGADQAVCILNAATGVTLTSNIAGAWAAKSGNVGTSNIVSPNSMNTQVNNFSVVGDYNYINTNNGCTDTVKVTVTPAGSIGNYVWKDQNNDGLQNEPVSNGINGITVELYKKDGLGAFNLYASTTTANNGSGNPGYYNFGICEDGVYKVRVPTVNPFTQTHLTAQDATASTDGNSDVNPADGFSPEITIDTHGSGVAKDNNTIDAGYQICTKPIAGNDFTSCGGQVVAITGVSTTPALPTTDGNWTAISSNPAGAILSATTLGVATVQFDSLASGVYHFVYTVTGGCDDTMNITVGSKPAAGSDLYEVCGGSIIPVTGMPGGGTWSQASANASGATVGTTSNGIANISFANLVSGTYTFIYTTPFGCTDTMTISTKPKPNAGSDVYMECGTPRLYDTISATPSGGVWTALSSNNNLVTLGTTTPSGKARIDLPTAPNQGSWSFIYTAPNGCTDTMTYVIGVTGTPAPAINSGSSPICGNSTVQICPTQWGWSNYQWYKNGIAVSGIAGTQACITVDTSSIGSYTLAGTNGAACWSKQSPAVVISITGAVTPTITSQSGSFTACNNGSITLISSSAQNNQWNKDGNPISGATSQYYTASVNGVYTVTTTNCGYVRISGGVTVTIVPQINVASIQSNTGTVCTGSSITLTNATTGGVWSSSNTAKATVSSTGVVTGVGVGSVTITYTVTVSGCSNSSGYTLNVADGSNITAPAIAAQSSTGLCGSSTVQVCPTVWGWNNYQWYKNGIAVTQNGNGSCITVDTSALGSYTLSATNSNGCWSPVSNAVTVSIASAPTTPIITVNGSSSTCNGQPITMTSSSSSGNQWKKDGIAISGATGQTYQTSATGVYTVTVTDNCGGTATSAGTSLSIAPYITVNSIQSVTASICKNATSALVNTTPGGVWSSNNPSVATINASGVVTGVDTGTVTITYTVTVGTCSNSVSATFTVVDGSNITAPAIIAQSSAALCANGNVTLCPTSFGWSGYQWYKNGVAVYQNGYGACITVDTSALGNYTLAGAGGNGCWSGQSNAIAVSLASAPAAATVTAGGSTSICNGSSVTLTSSVSSNNQWYKDGVAISGAMGQTYAATTSGVYKVAQTSNCGSTLSNGVTITVAAPITVASITSNSSSTICFGNSMALSCPTPGGAWSSSNTSVATVNASGVVSTLSAGTAVISYAITSGACSGSSTYTITVQNGTVTTPVINATGGATAGSTAICGSGSLQMCPLNWGYSNYQWYKDGAPYSTAACITVNTAGAYTLAGTNGAGCWSAQSTAANVTVNVIPTVVASTGPSAVCVGASISLSNSSTIPGGGTGIWTSIAGRATVNSSSGVVTGSSAGIATIVYTVTSSVGCAASTSSSVTVNANPNVPGIGYASGSINPQTGAGGGSNFCNNRNFTLAGSPAGGVWSSTGGVTVNPSTGAAATTTLGAASITYTITVNGCSNSRTITGTVVTCAGGRGVNTNVIATNDTKFTLYPNPAKTFIRLNVETLIGSGSIVLTDMYGKQVKQQPLSMGINTIDVRRLSKGMYMVSIITQSGTQTQKIVVE